MLSRTVVAMIVALVAAGGCSQNPKPASPPQPPPSSPQAPMPQTPALQPAQPIGPALVPLPALVEPGQGEGFTINAATTLKAHADPGVQRTARQIAEWIRRATGFTVGATPAAGTDPAAATT